MEELLEAIAWFQLGIHEKPVREETNITDQTTLDQSHYQDIKKDK